MWPQVGESRSPGGRRHHWELHTVGSQDAFPRGGEGVAASGGRMSVARDKGEKTASAAEAIEQSRAEFSTWALYFS